MEKKKIVKRLKDIIDKQGRYHAFSVHTQPLLEKLIKDIEGGA